MKNKKGFTLIELLAVIVVLAIIALIATPIVMNTIKKSQKGAAERSADNYIEAVETAVATSRLDSEGVQDGTYTINDKGNLEGNGLEKPLTIEMSGNKPKSGTITIKNGQVTTSSTMTIGSYEVSYNPTNKKYEATEKDSLSTEVLCRANTSKVIATVYTMKGDPWDDSSYVKEEVGLLASESATKYEVGVTYTCDLGTDDATKNLTFYVLETNGDNVSLIAGMNLGDTVAWVYHDDYIAAGGTESDWNKECEGCGNTNLDAISAKKELKTRTSAWTKLGEDQVTLPSRQQIATAGGDTTWNDGTDDYNTRVTLPTWLYSDSDGDPGFYFGYVGYWTSTPYSASVSEAWYVNNLRKPWKEVVDNASLGAGSIDRGLRPVITISKSQLG